MIKPLKHKTMRIAICTECKIQGATYTVGYDILKRLHAGIAVAGTSAGPEFEISGQVTSSGCQATCTAAYYGSQAGCYLFGGIAEGQEIADLLVYAQIGCSMTLLCEPASVMALEPAVGSLH